MYCLEDAATWVALSYDLAAVRAHRRHFTADKPFNTLVYFASAAFIVEISGIQICGWLHKVSEPGASSIVSVLLPCDHIVIGIATASPSHSGGTSHSGWQPQVRLHYRSVVVVAELRCYRGRGGASSVGPMASRSLARQSG